MGKSSPSHRAPPRAWQRMLSGRRLDLLDPSPFDVEITDIAHGLARVARWNGQTKGPYPFSVAQHALLVEAIARYLRPDITEPNSSAAKICLAVLLHDAAEYVIGDIISPFKAVLGDAYKGVEHRILAAVMLRFGLPAEIKGPTKTLTKQADCTAAYYEAVMLAGFEPAEAARFFGKPLKLPSHLLALLEPWTPEEAGKAFTSRFEDLLAQSFH
jgi:uncharacterized protein